MRCIGEYADIPLDSFLENLYGSDIRLRPMTAQKERKMRKIVFGISLLVALVVTGCASSQLHQSLLLQENRQLEDALYVAHSQVVDLQRENNWLRNKQNDDSLDLNEDFDLIPPYEMPKVILPSQPGTTELPDALKGSQGMRTWSPRR